MKKLTKVLALVFALIMLMSSTAMAKEYVAATNPEFPPFESVGDSGEMVGIDIDILNALIAKMDSASTVRIDAMDFGALIPSLLSGKIEIIIAGMSATDERKQSVDFTDPYFDAVQAMIVQEGSAIKTESDLAGKKIGVQLGTTGDLYVTDNIKASEINRFNKGIDAVQDVISGRLDAVVIDAAPAAVFAQQAKGLVLLDEKLNSGNEQYAIAIAKGNEELLKGLNAALAEIKADGTLDAILAKHMAG
ncbi:MAG: basic amino acid ABC transporter substrate-binding protein [Clostridia bacterium]